MSTEHSIVIPVHGRSSLTATLIERLLAEDHFSTEVILVDDGSDDRAFDSLGAYADRVRIERRGARGGFAAACNKGVESSEGRLIVFLNNDVLPTPGWLDALAGEADRRPVPTIVGAKLLWPDNTVQHAGVVIDGGGNPRHVYPGFPADHPAVSRSRGFQAVTAAAMLVERDAFAALGGFDEGFVNGFEDVDFCLRAGELGFDVRYCPSAVLYHLEGATRGVALLDDVPNWRLYRARWADRVRPDDLTTYVEDALVGMEYEPDGNLRLRIMPELGLAAGADHNRLERALAEHARRSFALRRENSDLALTPEQRPVRWRNTVPRRSTGGNLTISVVSGLGDHHCHVEYVEALAAQSLSAARFEVLLVDSRNEVDDQAEIERALRKARRRIRIDYASSPSSTGRAGALNRGIRAATGDVILFLADDFVPQPRLVEEHLAAHEADPRPEAAALGPAFFPKSFRADPFIRWLEDSATLFGVSFTTAGEQLPPDFFYCANASVKRSFLLGDELFDERLNREAWDDYELGLRLRDRGLEVTYLRTAAAWHDHRLTLEERTAVSRNAGVSAARFDRIYPPPHRWTSWTDASEPLFALRATALEAKARHKLTRREADLARHYDAVLRRAFLEGYRQEAWPVTSATV